MIHSHVWGSHHAKFDDVLWQGEWVAYYSMECRKKTIYTAEIRTTKWKKNLPEKTKNNNSHLYYAWGTITMAHENEQSLCQTWESYGFIRRKNMLDYWIISATNEVITSQKVYIHIYIYTMWPSRPKWVTLLLVHFWVLPLFQRRCHISIWAFPQNQFFQSFVHQKITFVAHTKSV